MDPLALPSKEKLREIAAKQDAKEKEILERRAAERAQLENGQDGQDDRRKAAEKIQRNYRGYRQRRELRGHGLSPTERWTEALKTAQFQNKTKPRPWKESIEKGSGPNSARSTWQRAGAIARQAGNDDTSDTEGDDGMTAEQLEKYREKKRKKKAEREEYAKTMGLEYFLEMVDQKHRYGSSLRKYHKVWQESESKENFFYWLDYGDGLKVDLEERPRKRLDEEQIRYLSREERKRYLIEIDKNGLFRYARNGELITTSPDFKDSIDGIVPADSKKPTWREVTQGKEGTAGESDSDEDSDQDSDSVSGISVGSQEDAANYTNQDLHDAKGLKKLKHISAGALMNRLLRKTTKKNTWIFVADTSFRVYIGIKQSGAFQHSSFMHGARVASAGLIRIKRGQLRKLDPLSGHYAPPARNFRGFVHSLRDAGADMSRVSISRSYAILLGLESYVGTKKRLAHGGQKVKDVLNPAQAREREEAQRDTTQSAEKERRHLEAQAAESEAARKRDGKYSIDASHLQERVRQTLRLDERKSNEDGGDEASKKVTGEPEVAPTPEKKALADEHRSSGVDQGTEIQVKQAVAGQ